MSQTESATTPATSATLTVQPVAKPDMPGAVQPATKLDMPSTNDALSAASSPELSIGTSATSESPPTFGMYNGHGMPPPYGVYNGYPPLVCSPIPYDQSTGGYPPVVPGQPMPQYLPAMLMPVPPDVYIQHLQLHVLQLLQLLPQPLQVLHLQQQVHHLQQQVHHLLQSQPAQPAQPASHAQPLMQMLLTQQAAPQDAPPQDATPQGDEPVRHKPMLPPLPLLPMSELPPKMCAGAPNQRLSAAGSLLRYAKILPLTLVKALGKPEIVSQMCKKCLTARCARWEMRPGMPPRFIAICGESARVLHAQSVCTRCNSPSCCKVSLTGEVESICHVCTKCPKCQVPACTSRLPNMDQMHTAIPTARHPTQCDYDYVWLETHSPWLGAVGLSTYKPMLVYDLRAVLTDENTSGTRLLCQYCRDGCNLSWHETDELQALCASCMMVISKSPRGVCHAGRQKCTGGPRFVHPSGLIARRCTECSHGRV